MIEGNIAPPVADETANRHVKADKLEPVAGELTKLIGSGENAQNSIVYRTVGWSFSAATFFSVLAFGYAAYKGTGDAVETVKTVWAVFIPIITLSLGYVFGRASG
ncbi:hypothetical protein [Paraburkholderia sp. C35]|uniref:hypothetical protein n=1 Tax=Paraburkholderia sp. C35 TaxID=2126993 RepID=UPI000D688DC1|nr:hypothetical protein [Paraburkholderia sp. C35]